MARALAATLSWLILTCGIATAAKAPPRKPPVAAEPPMHVSIVKSAEAGCEPNCPEWIAAQGKIDAGTVARFKTVMKRLGARKLPVLIHSSGGDMDASFAIGRLLRKSGFDIAVARTAFVPCAPGDAGCRKARARGEARGLPDEQFSICASACAFVLAAGVRRVVGLRAFVGVHQVMLMQTYNKVLRTYQVTVRPSASGGRPKIQKKLIATKIVSQKVVPRKAPQSTYASIEQYFAEMGVARQIMPMLQGTPHAGVRWLTHEELRGTGIATHRMEAVQLIAGVAAEGDDSSGFGEGEVPASPPAECQYFSGIGIGCSPLSMPQDAEWSIQAPDSERAAPAR